ncbi:hypothetical protein DYD21_13175 [Rhodohalobacter sp. SW132]|uniref:hypothetical protein n=1 Tax=Rhodohalobacter sp. SW132 TaxID=2293433 RepID=UPI000E288820|nr:hypothetical protein [Rhodohalobacter sp. SW132]REL33200.1 hypothetical protein DYD21_13175 [Rhodohalobacter sp. SW132]
MGQQQLLLVILVTIIVGIATVVAINTFGSAADQANIDAVNNDIAALASAAQGYYMRPGMLGGGGRTFDGTGTPQSGGISFDGMAFPATEVGGTESRTAVNENGRYVIEDVTPQSFTIRADPASCEGFTPGIDGSGCTDANDQITAAVGPNNFELGATGEPETTTAD